MYSRHTPPAAHCRAASFLHEKFSAATGANLRTAYFKEQRNFLLLKNFRYENLLSFFIGSFFSCYPLAALVADRAARFASRLAGAPAFAAAAELSFGRFCYSFDHNAYSPLQVIFLYYKVMRMKNQAILQDFRQGGRIYFTACPLNLRR